MALTSDFIRLGHNQIRCYVDGILRTQITAHGLQTYDASEANTRSFTGMWAAPVTVGFQIWREGGLRRVHIRRIVPAAAAAADVITLAAADALDAQDRPSIPQTCIIPVTDNSKEGLGLLTVGTDGIITIKLFSNSATTVLESGVFTNAGNCGTPGDISFTYWAVSNYSYPD